MEDKDCCSMELGHTTSLSELELDLELIMLKRFWQNVYIIVQSIIIPCIQLSFSFAGLEFFTLVKRYEENEMSCS